MAELTVDTHLPAQEVDPVDGEAEQLAGPKARSCGQYDERQQPRRAASTSACTSSTVGGRTSSRLTFGKLPDSTDLPFTDDLLDDDGLVDGAGIDDLIARKPRLAARRPAATSARAPGSRSTTSGSAPWCVAGVSGGRPRRGRRTRPDVGPTSE